MVGLLVFITFIFTIAAATAARRRRRHLQRLQRRQVLTRFHAISYKAVVRRLLRNRHLQQEHAFQVADKLDLQRHLDVKYYPSSADFIAKVIKRERGGLFVYSSIRFTKGSLFLYREGSQDNDVHDLAIFGDNPHATLGYQTFFPSYEQYHRWCLQNEVTLRVLQQSGRAVWGQISMSATGMAMVIGCGSELYALLRILQPVQEGDYTDLHISLAARFFRFGVPSHTIM